jgi:hypothetical protein
VGGSRLGFAAGRLRLRDDAFPYGIRDPLRPRGGTLYAAAAFSVAVAARSALSQFPAGQKAAINRLCDVRHTRMIVLSDCLLLSWGEVVLQGAPFSWAKLIRSKMSFTSLGRARARRVAWPWGAPSARG